MGEIRDRIDAAQEKKAELHLRAHNNGEAEAQYELGQYYSSKYPDLGEDKDDEKTIRLWTIAAEQGHAGAQYELSKYYLSNDEKNYATAVELLTKAAEQGLPAAQWQLADWYYWSTGPAETDEEKAFYWIIKAAKQDLSDEECSRGESYLKGLKVADGKPTAMYWLEKAQEQGSKMAEYWVSILC